MISRAVPCRCAAALSGLVNWCGANACRSLASRLAPASAPATPSAWGVRTTEAPNASMISRRSALTFSGITAMNLSPICAEASAMAMLVDPLDASTTVPPGGISPSRRALPRM